MYKCACYLNQDGAKEAAGGAAPMKSSDSMDADSPTAEAAVAGDASDAIPATETPSPMETDEVEQLA